MKQIKKIISVENRLMKKLFIFVCILEVEDDAYLLIDLAELGEASPSLSNCKLTLLSCSISLLKFN